MVRLASKWPGAALTAPAVTQEVVAPMHCDSIQPRPRGTGSLLRHTHKDGRETWYGKWWSGGRQIMRVLGPVRPPRSREGLTRSQAEAALRQAIEASRTTRRLNERLDLAEAGRRYLANREAIGLKPGTLADYESFLRVHTSPTSVTGPSTRSRPRTSRRSSAQNDRTAARPRASSTTSASSKPFSPTPSNAAGAPATPSPRSTSPATNATTRSATSPTPSSRHSSPTPPTTSSATSST
jgi:hypothetical protein